MINELQALGYHPNETTLSFMIHLADKRKTFRITEIRCVYFNTYNFSFALHCIAEAWMVKGLDAFKY